MRRERRAGSGDDASIVNVFGWSRDAAGQNNFDTIRRDAHTIRGGGGSSNVGATTLVNLCDKISVACKAGQLNEARLLIASLQSEYEDRVAPAIVRLREKLGQQRREVLETQR